MSLTFSPSGFPLQDLVVGASVYFPPLFKAVFVGFFIWLIVHRLLRDWIYSGEIWHPHVDGFIPFRAVRQRRHGSFGDVVTQ
ncbi:Protein of uncharacterised function (DUF1656) [Cedecea neteri]|uniref:Protein of uncharacterized function (DUF1656) n=1 Tax=Cedecea neteri TaxID=158822 RepID=A0A2X3JAP3_9ENTR|nr:Protein of uncharacterised function (DUF1656) [Cedecea neteri]